MVKSQNTDETKDQSWLQTLFFAGDITAQLINFNLKWQGKNKIIATCFITELSLWMSQVSNENLVHSATCKKLENTANTESVFSFARYDIYLDLCYLRNFRKYFEIFHLSNLSWNYFQHHSPLMLSR